MSISTEAFIFVVYKEKYTMTTTNQLAAHIEILMELQATKRLSQRYQLNQRLDQSRTSLVAAGYEYDFLKEIEFDYN